MDTVFWATYLALWIVVIVQGLAFLEILRQIGALRGQLPAERPLVVADAVRIGDPLPPLSARSADRLEPAAWKDHFIGPLNVAVFLTPRCPHCYALAQDLTDYAKRLKGQVGVVVVLTASMDEGRKFIGNTGLDLRRRCSSRKAVSGKPLL